MRVMRIDEKLAAVNFPALEEIHSIELRQEDVFILAAGFEDRTLACLRQIKSTSSKISIIILSYAPEISENLFNNVCSFCQEKNYDYETIPYNRSVPDSLNSIVDSFIIRNCKGNIYLDISAMSRLLIVQILYALRNYLHNIKILYTESESYSPTFTEYEEEMEKAEEASTEFPMFISSGVADIYFPSVFSTSALQGQPLRLIVFPSFNPYQLRSVVNELQPSFLDIINGVSPRDNNSWRTDAILRLNKVDSIRQKKDLYYTSTFDYRETLDLLIQIYQKENVFDQITIIPTGSKLQSLAVAIFRLYMEDIRIAYPLPQKFNDVSSYSSGVLNSYLLELNFLATL